MRRFLRRRALALVVVAVLGAWLAYAPGRIEHLRAGIEPLSVELPVMTGGRLEAPVTIPVRTQYHLALQFDRIAFERSGGSFEELRLLVGGMVRGDDGWTDTAGVPVPIRWTVRDQVTGTLVTEGYDADGGAGPPVSTASSRAEVRRVMASVTLEPGQYLFQAELLAPAPVLAPTNPRLVLESWSKDSGNGAGPRVMAMTVYTKLLVLPVFALTLTYLMVMAAVALTADRPETENRAA